MKPTKNYSFHARDTSYDSSQEEEKSNLLPHKRDVTDHGTQMLSIGKSEGKNSFLTNLKNYFSRQNPEGMNNDADTLKQHFIPISQVDKAKANKELTHKPSKGPIPPKPQVGKAQANKELTHKLSEGLIEFLNTFNPQYAVDAMKIDYSNRHGNAPQSNGAVKLVTEVAGDFLKKGADPCFVDKNGENALSVAILKGYLEVAKKLIDDPEMKLNSRLPGDDPYGTTIGGLAALRAIHSRNPTILTKLLPKLDLSITTTYGTSIGDLLVSNLITYCRDEKIVLDLMRDGRIELDKVEPGQIHNKAEIFLYAAIRCHKAAIADYLLKNASINFDQMSRLGSNNEMPYKDNLSAAATTKKMKDLIKPYCDVGTTFDTNSLKAPADV